MMDFEWAANFPDLYKACTLFNLTHLSNPIRFCYKPVTKIKQEGPQCGIVALAMCMQEPTKDTVHTLQTQAQELGYTYNGEIFSAKYMSELAQLNINSKISLHSGQLHSETVKDFLLSGGLILVPYDTDKNHAPCLNQGHKAHWALLSGIIVTENGDYVTAYHGKSNNVAIWKLSELAESNAQLIQFSPDRKLHQVQYMLPNGGISGPYGLQNKAVFVHPAKNDVDNNKK